MVKNKKAKIEILNQEIRNCKKCPLGKTRKNAVPGEGPANAKIMIIGEAAGSMEDKTGRPFIGPAGKFLDKLLKIAQLDRKKIYITSVVKCRPTSFSKRRKNMKWTIDEKILKTLYSKERKSIDDIDKILNIPRYAINYWRRKYKIKRLTYFERHPLPKLSKIQKEYLFGALLGDDRLGKNKEETYPSLKVGHGIKQKDYVFWKYNIWKNLVLSGVKKVKIRVKDKIYFSYQFFTREHPEFLNFYRLFYKNCKKRISKEILNQLTPFSLAIWYMDDGSYIKSRGRALLATNSFNYKEQLIIQKYFKDKWSLSTTIGTSDSGTYYLRFNTEHSIKFLKIIEKYIIPYFHYKIDPGRKLLYRKLSTEELDYIKNNYKTKSPKLIAQKLRRDASNIRDIIYRLKLADLGKNKI